MSGEGRAAAAHARRRSWPVRLYRLGAGPGDDLSATTTAEERLAMMWPLAQEAWALAGRPMPPCPRHQVQVRVRRLGEAPSS